MRNKARRTSGAERIRKMKKAMVENERRYLRLIWAENKEGRGYEEITMSISGRNAIERLIEKGKIHFRHSHVFSTYHRQGYWMK